MYFPRREVLWWIWDYINYYPLQSITEEYASSDFQLRATMEQYKQDLSGHNLALRIQKYVQVDGTGQVQVSQAYTPPTNITDIVPSAFLKICGCHLETILHDPRILKHVHHQR